MNTSHIDKSNALHFAVCFISSILSTELAIGLGVGKEVGDKVNYGHFCHWDIFFDALGAILGTAVRLGAIRLLYGYWKYNWV